MWLQCGLISVRLSEVIFWFVCWFDLLIFFYFVLYLFAGDIMIAPESWGHGVLNIQVGPWIYVHIYERQTYVILYTIRHFNFCKISRLKKIVSLLRLCCKRYSSPHAHFMSCYVTLCHVILCYVSSQDSIAVATESKGSLWRIKQQLPFSSKLTSMCPYVSPAGLCAVYVRTELAGFCCCCDIGIGIRPDVLLATCPVMAQHVLS